MSEQNNSHGFETICIHGGHSPENKRAHPSPSIVQNKVLQFLKKRKKDTSMAGLAIQIPTR
jgi:putative intracellular protease/amidase